MKERDETRERFLAAIAGRIDPGAVAEAHLFQPIKQGGTESGVAVVAVREGQLVTGGEAAAEHRADARSSSAENVGNRLAVYTATYRLTLKGPERGKWDFTIQADADAPLVTVDRVVQGVQRRSGDAEDPSKLSGDEFRALLPGR
ncbi:MAG: hypothetical protein WD825_05800 [Gemmatimonadaceae bacterium]